MAVEKVTSANFESFISDNTPVVIDFYADWCGPCRMLAPVVEALAQEGIAKVGKVNVDEESALAARFGVSSIPFVAVFRGGELTATSLGYVTLAQLKAKLGL